MDEVFVYLVSLPPGIKEMVTPCADGYTVYIDVDLDRAARMKAYRHAMQHITREDFRKTDVQSIEREAHQCG